MFKANGTTVSIMIWLASLLLLNVSHLVKMDGRMSSVVIGEVSLFLPLAATVIAGLITRERLGLTKINIKKSIALALIASPFTWITVLIADDFFETLVPPPESYVEANRELIPSTVTELAFWITISLVIVAPAEELLFRGLVQRALTASFGTNKGILLASSLFALSHFDPWRGVGAIVLGIVAGYVFHKTGNISSPIIMHGLNNSTSYFFAYLSATVSGVLSNHG